MSKHEAPRKKRQPAEGVVRDASGNRISLDALGAVDAKRDRRERRPPAREKPRPAKRKTAPPPPPTFVAWDVPERRSGLGPAVRLLALAVILVGGGYLLAHSLSEPEPLPGTVRNAADTKRTLYLGVLKIEAYRKVNGLYPFEIRAAGVDDRSGYRYERVSDERYRLTFHEADGSKATFDSATPIERFFGRPEEVLARKESP